MIYVLMYLFRVRTRRNWIYHLVIRSRRKIEDFDNSVSTLLTLRNYYRSMAVIRSKSSNNYASLHTDHYSTVTQYCVMLDRNEPALFIPQILSIRLVICFPGRQ